MPQVVSVEKQRTRGKVHAALVSVLVQPWRKATRDPVGHMSTPVFFRFWLHAVLLRAVCVAKIKCGKKGSMLGNESILRFCDGMYVWES